MATSYYGVVSIIQPPLLKKVDQPSLIQLETAYAAYCVKVEDANKDRDANAKISAASIKDCMDPATLHALCLIGGIEGASLVEEATVDMVKAWFEKASLSTPKDLSERIDATLRSVTFKPNKDDPAGGVANFIIDVITALDQNNASEILKDVDMAKKFIDRLVNNFTLQVLLERIKMMRRGWKKDQLASMKLFKDEVSNIALEISLTETALLRVHPKQSRTLSDHARKQNECSKNNKPEKKSSGNQANDGKRAGKRKETEWNQPCLRPDCKGIHRMRDCPNTSNDGKKELFEQRYGSKDTKRAKEIKATSIWNDPIPDATAGRFRIALEDCLFDIVLADSGANFRAIDSKVFNQVKSALPKITVKVFDKPVLLAGSFSSEDDIKVSTSRSVTLTVTIYLPGSNIPVRVRGVEFYVVDRDMDEILLGRPFLNSIGFNLGDHLERVRNDIHDRHVDELDGIQFKIATTKYQGLSYIEAGDDDPIELSESLAAGIGKDSDESIDQAITRILANTESNGMSTKSLQEMTNLLKEFRNIFRIKLGSDFPVDVPPLIITPVQNAKSYRCPQRRYAPQQRDFIIQTVRELEAVSAIYRNSSARWASPASRAKCPDFQSRLRRSMRI